MSNYLTFRYENADPAVRDETYVNTDVEIIEHLRLLVRELHWPVLDDAKLPEGTIVATVRRLLHYTRRAADDEGWRPVLLCAGGIDWLDRVMGPRS